MQFRVLLMLALSAVLMSACNLGGTPQQEEDIATADSADLGRPSINILSPTTGENFIVNEQVAVSVSATDAIGVTRVQLFANGNLVKTVSSEFANGEVSYEGVLDFTPRTEGDFDLRVIAYRNAISSDPQEVTVTVGAEQITITQRPSTTTGSSTGNTTGSTTGSTTGNVGNPVPIIPNDGVCRVLTNVGLNFRTEPTTTRDNVITTFPQNTLLVVVARLGDNSWWKVSSTSRVGWVSGNSQFVTLYGNCSGVPIESVVINTPTFTPPTQTPPPTLTPLPTDTPIPGKPDLSVPSIAIDEEIIIPAGQTQITVEVTVTVKNDGDEDSPQFDVTLTVEGTEDVVYDVATIGNLEPGAIITLTQEVIFDAAGEYDIQVDVDPENEVDEGGEFNNRADTTVTVINAE